MSKRRKRHKKNINLQITSSNPLSHLESALNGKPTAKGREQLTGIRRRFSIPLALSTLCLEGSAVELSGHRERQTSPGCTAPWLCSSRSHHHQPRPSQRPNLVFHKRPSTGVPPRIESILYPQSYCSLDRSQIHSLFNQEVCLDRFRTPHYPALPNAAPAHRPLDYGRSGWRDQHRIPRRQFPRCLLLSV